MGVVDLFFIITGAVLASASITAWYDRPLLVAAACAAILVAVVARHHRQRDIVGLLVGATLGNIIELACDAAGVWRHADRSVLGLAPAYIFLCYPILGIAAPRLVDALIGRARPLQETRRAVAPVAAVLLAGLVALSMRFGGDHSAQSIVCAVLLALTLWQFHSRHDGVTAIAGAIIALVWEIPATMAGAWRFPDPQIAGLIPLWLPAAYAVFFVTMGRLSAAFAQ